MPVYDTRYGVGSTRQPLTASPPPTKGDGGVSSRFQETRSTYPPTTVANSNEHFRGGGELVAAASVTGPITCDATFYESILRELPNSPEIAHSVLFTQRGGLEIMETPDEQLKRVDESVRRWRVHRQEECGQEARLKEETEGMALASERLEDERRSEEQRIRVETMQSRMDELDRIFQSRIDVATPSKDHSGNHSSGLLSPLKGEWDELASRQKRRQREVDDELRALETKQRSRNGREVELGFVAEVGKIGITEQLSRAVLMSEQETCRVRLRRLACESKERVRSLEDAESYINASFFPRQAAAWGVLMDVFGEGPQHQPPPLPTAVPRAPTPPSPAHSDQIRAMKILQQARELRNQAETNSTDMARYEANTQQHLQQTVEAADAVSLFTPKSEPFAPHGSSSCFESNSQREEHESHQAGEVNRETLDYSASINSGRPGGTAGGARGSARTSPRVKASTSRPHASSPNEHSSSQLDRWQRRRTSNDVRADSANTMDLQHRRGSSDGHGAFNVVDHDDNENSFGAPGGGHHIDDKSTSESP